MNKKVLGIALTIFFLAMLTIPVMAEPATIEEVTMTAVVTQVIDPDFPRMVSHNTISHGRGTSSGTVTLNIPGQIPPVLSGDWAGEWISRGNFKKAPGELVIMGKVVWTFADGTFEGTLHRKIIGFPPSGSSIFIDHMVLQGTGDFKGQTLKLSKEGTPAVIAEGYLIIPK